MAVMASYTASLKFILECFVGESMSRGILYPSLELHYTDEDAAKMFGTVFRSLVWIFPSSLEFLTLF